MKTYQQQFKMSFQHKQYLARTLHSISLMKTQLKEILYSLYSELVTGLANLSYQHYP